MNATNFCYWLQGFCEISGQNPTKEQWDIIKNHLKILKPDAAQQLSSSKLYINTNVGASENIVPDRSIHE